MTIKGKQKQISVGQKFSDLVSATVKSWGFVLTQSSIILLWIILNLTPVLGYKWDPYPFEILRLILTIEASFIATMLIMNQSRLDEKDRRVALGDYYLELQIKNEIKNVRPIIERMETRLSEIEKKIDNQK